MAALDFTRGAQSTRSIGQFFASAMSSLKTWNDDRATRAALGKLTDQELDDIGLIRGDLENLRYTNLIR